MAKMMSRSECHQMLATAISKHLMAVASMVFIDFCDASCNGRGFAKRGPMRDCMIDCQVAQAVKARPKLMAAP